MAGSRDYGSYVVSMRVAIYELIKEVCKEDKDEMARQLQVQMSQDFLPFSNPQEKLAPALLIIQQIIQADDRPDKKQFWQQVINPEMTRDFPINLSDGARQLYFKLQNAVGARISKEGFEGASESNVKTICEILDQRDDLRRGTSQEKFKQKAMAEKKGHELKIEGDMLSKPDPHGYLEVFLKFMNDNKELIKATGKWKLGKFRIPKPLANPGATLFKWKKELEPQRENFEELAQTYAASLNMDIAALVEGRKEKKHFELDEITELKRDRANATTREAVAGIVQSYHERGRSPQDLAYIVMYIVANKPLLAEAGFKEIERLNKPKAQSSAAAAAEPRDERKSTAPKGPGSSHVEE